MSSLGLPVPPGFTITTEVCAAWNRGGIRTISPDRSTRRSPRRAGDGRRVRRRGRPAPGFGPFGRAGIDAGHARHGAELGAERRDGSGVGREERGFALRVGQLPAFRSDVRQRRPRGRSRPFRGDDRRPEGGRRARFRPRRRRLEGARGGVQGTDRSGNRAGLSPESPRPALGAIDAVFGSCATSAPRPTARCTESRTARARR